MSDEEESQTDFDFEVIMAEIKVGSEDLSGFLEWCASTDIEPEEFQSVAELVYSYCRNKNEAEEDELRGDHAE